LQSKGSIYSASKSTKSELVIATEKGVEFGRLVKKLNTNEQKFK